MFCFNISLASSTVFPTKFGISTSLGLVAFDIPIVKPIVIANNNINPIIDDKTLSMRVYERGSGETLACGTGACAVAVAAVLNGICKKNEDITVRLLGGSLKIKYTDETVFMTGPAKKVFEGEVEI